MRLYFTWEVLLTGQKLLNEALNNRQIFCDNLDLLALGLMEVTASASVDLLFCIFWDRMLSQRKQAIYMQTIECNLMCMSLTVNTMLLHKTNIYYSF